MTTTLNFSSQTPVMEIRGHKSSVTSLAWSPDGLYLASSSGDHTIRIWSMEPVLTSSSSSPSYQELKGHGGGVDHVSWSPAGNGVLASLSSSDKTLRIWSSNTNTSTVSSSAGFTGINFAWNPSGTKLIIGGKDDTIKIVDASTGQDIQSRKFPMEINQIVWRDEAICLTTGHGSVVLLDPEDLTKELGGALHGHTSNCYCIAASSTSSRIAVGAADALVSIWDLHHRACSRTIGRLDWPIRTLSFSSCGRFLASGSEDAYIDVAEVESGRQVGKVPVAGTVTSVAWHPSRLVLAWAAEEMDSKSNRSLGNFRLVGI